MERLLSKEIKLTRIFSLEKRQLRRSMRDKIMRLIFLETDEVLRGVEETMLNHTSELLFLSEKAGDT